MSYASLNETDVRFKMVFYSNGGKYIYIDDINITTPALSTPEQMEALLGLSIYPNPADDQTQISFNLNQTSMVKIGVYDLTGRRILDLMNQPLPGGGHTFNISKKDLSGSGAYILKISVYGVQINRKLIVQ